MLIEWQGYVALGVQPIELKIQAEFVFSNISQDLWNFIVRMRV